MTLDQIANMVLEGIRANHIVDDEDIDLRLVKDWIHLKRAQYIRNVTKNPSARISLANYQTYTATVSVVNIVKISEYPFDDTTDPNRQSLKIVASTQPIPRILESNEGYMVYSVETEDLMKYPFTFVDYDYLRVAGNGRFNSQLVFAAVRDNYLYLKHNSIFDTPGDGISTIKLRAVFTNPTEITGFVDTTSIYPCSPEVVEYIKNGIYDKDAKMLLTTKADTENDASGEIK